MNAFVGIAWGGREGRGKAAVWEVLFKQRCSWVWSHSQSAPLRPQKVGFVCTVQAFISNGWAPFSNFPSFSWECGGKQAHVVLLE